MALMALIFQLTCNLNRYKESPEEYAHFLVRTSSTYLHMDNWYNSLGINCQASMGHKTKRAKCVMSI